MRLSTVDAVSRRALATRFMLTAIGTMTGLPSSSIAAGGPSSLSGKPRPETNVILLEPPEQSGATISAEILCNGAASGQSVIANTAFESAFAIAKGNYYDVEARNKDGDAAFVHVARLPAGQKLDAISNSFFTDTALGPTGRFGSYSAPQITSVGKGVVLGPRGVRYVDVSFNALTQAGFEVPRRGVIAAVQPMGSSDVLMLVSTVGAARWKKGGEADVRSAAESFRVTRTRPSSLPAQLDNDYRYNGRSLKGLSAEQSEIDAALARELSTQSSPLEGKFRDAAVKGYAPNF